MSMKPAHIGTVSGGAGQALKVEVADPDYSEVRISVGTERRMSDTGRVLIKAETVQLRLKEVQRLIAFLERGAAAVEAGRKAKDLDRIHEGKGQ